MYLRNAVEFQQNTRRYIPEDSTLYNNRYKNLKSYIDLLLTNLVSAYSYSGNFNIET
jgi:hypothetical protein